MGTYKRTLNDGRQVWYARVQHHGKRATSSYYQQKWRAEERDAEMHRAVVDGSWDQKYGRDLTPTFAALIKMYLQESLARKQSPRTLESKRGHFKIINEEFPWLASMRIDKITSFEVYRIRKGLLERGCSGPTSNRYIATLSGAFKLARAVYGTDNPCAGIPRFEENTEGWTRLEAADFDKILEASKLDRIPQLDTVLLLIWDTGLRAKEIPTSWDQVRWGFGEYGGIFLPVHKTGTEATVPITKRLAVALRAHMELRPDDPIFINVAGRPLTYWNLDDAWQRIRARTKTKARLHDLRHAYATRMIEHGANPKMLQRILRHKTSAMVDRYVHLTDESAAAAVTVLDGESQ